MSKKRAFYLVIFFTCMYNANGQFSPLPTGLSNRTDGFFTAVKNKKWILSKYLIVSTGTNKTSSFSNAIFTFSENDTTGFLIEIPGKNKMTGGWTTQHNNSLSLSLPVITTDSSFTPSDFQYNEGVKMLSAWPLQKIAMLPSLLSFKMIDPIRGEILIEFTKKD